MTEPTPDSTAVRVTLWRAMHVEIDPRPHVLEDLVGLRLVTPDEGWRRRPDMDPSGTRLILPLEFADPDERPGYEAAMKGARASRTPFISFFTPPEMLELARDAGFKEVRHVSAGNLTQRYFAGRADGLRPGSSEALLVAQT